MPLDEHWSDTIMYQTFFVFVKPFGVLAFVLNLIENHYKLTHNSKKLKLLTRLHLKLHDLIMIYTI